MGYLVIIYARRNEQVRDIVREHPAATVGVYAFPAKGEPVCSGFSTSCPDRANAWRRDMVAGHMTHGCGRRHKDWKARLVGSLFDILGLNLLPRARTPRLFQNPPSWEPTKKRAHPGE